VISNKIQVVYRLSNRVTLMWPVRPNGSNATKPTSYNLYWDTSAGGLFTTLLASVENASCEDHGGIRSYHKKVVYNIVPSQVSGWDNDATNYVKMKPVILTVEQAFEDLIIIPPYTVNGMRLHYPNLQPTAIVGYNDEENRFIPVSVDTDGKVETV